MMSPREARLDPNLRCAAELPAIAVSRHTPALAPSPQCAQGFPVIAASPRIRDSWGKLPAVSLTLGQPSLPSLTLLSWSMRPGQSARARLLRADGLSGSHGPSENGVDEQNIAIWLTSLRVAALPGLAARGRFGRPPRGLAGQSRHGPEQDGSVHRGRRRDSRLGRDLWQDGSLARGPGRPGRLGRDSRQNGDLRRGARRPSSLARHPGQDGGLSHGPGRAGSPGRDPKQHAPAGTASAGVGPGQADQSTPGASRWRRRAS